jgi:serine protease Do
MRRAIFALVALLLLGLGLFRLGQILLSDGKPQKSRGSSTGADADRKPPAYTPAEGPKLSARDVPGLTAIDEEYTRLVEAVLPAVVSITTQRVQQGSPTQINPFDLLFGTKRSKATQPEVVRALGSGVIVSREGHVLTNNHVIEGMTQIEVTLADERTFPARLLDTDPNVDIAILKVDAPKLEPLPLGDSEIVRVGQLVFAIGNPFGLSETVTAGIVSAKGRRTSRDSTVEYLQTDAAVNHGNSGGPLINLKGEIVGINTAIYARNEDSGWLGISFAVPSNVARRALDSVLKWGKIKRAYLGVGLQNLTPELVSKYKAGSIDGALVSDVVRESPAERAGMKPGDVVRKFNGRPVKDTAWLRSRLTEVDIGERVELIYFRNGNEMKATAEIGEAPPESELPQRQR